MVKLSKEQTFAEKWLEEIRLNPTPTSYISLTAKPTLRERIRNAWKGFTRG